MRNSANRCGVVILASVVSEHGSWLVALHRMQKLPIVRDLKRGRVHMVASGGV